MDEPFRDYGYFKNEKDEKILEGQIYYYTCLMITDYVSCMTDNYCVDLYRRLCGMNIN